MIKQALKKGGKAGCFFEFSSGDTIRYSTTGTMVQVNVAVRPTATLPCAYPWASASLSTSSTPTPVSHWLNVVMFSPKEQTLTPETPSLPKAASPCLNSYLGFTVSDWKMGAYTLIAMGEGLPAYGRFLKVWEE